MYKKDEGLNLDPSGNELYRRELIALTNENKLLKQNVHELQELLQKSYKRIGELIESE